MVRWEWLWFQSSSSASFLIVTLTTTTTSSCRTRARTHQKIKFSLEDRQMKQMDVDCKVGVIMKTQPTSPPPPPPLPPPLPRSWAAIKPAANSRSVESVTKQEIAKFWRQKRMEEEDHLLSALKAAARIRARNLTEEDYRHFEESVKGDISDGNKKDDKDNTSANEEKELRVGIKDWWTKSKYAYLNEPAIECMEKPKRSTYIPNFCFYKGPSSGPASLGVF